MPSAAEIFQEMDRRRTEVLQNYRPHPDLNQPAFHQSKKLIRMYLGGNGAGKTTICAAEVAAALTGQRFEWMGVKYPKPPLHCWIVKQKFPTNIQTDPIHAKLWAGEERYDFEKEERVFVDPLIPRRMQAGHNRSTNTYTLTNGSTFELKSAEQDPVQFGSSGINLIWIDEPISSVIFTELKFRIVRRMDSRMLIGMTPAYGGVNYLFELLEDKSGHVDVFFGSMDKNPYLDPKVKDYIISTTPKDMAETRIHGRPTYFTGLVYGEWDNWVPAFPIPREWTRYVVHDPGRNNPAATMWLAVEPGSNDIYIYNCDYDEAKLASIKPLCDRLLAKSIGQDIYKWIIDPFAASCRVPSVDDPNNEITIQQLYRQCGINFQLGPRQMDMAGFIQRITATKLYIDKRSPMPTVYALDTPEMNPFQKELRLYRWPSNQNKKQEKNNPDRPVDEWNHLMYCMETACAMGLKNKQEVRTEIGPHLPECDMARMIRERMEEMWSELQRRSAG